MYQDQKYECYEIAICQDKARGGDGTRYFDSLLSYKLWFDSCKMLGWIDEMGNLTVVGKAIGKACNHIGEERTYYHTNEYKSAARDVLQRFLT